MSWNESEESPENCERQEDENNVQNGDDFELLPSLSSVFDMSPKELLNEIHKQ